MKLENIQIEKEIIYISYVNPTEFKILKSKGIKTNIIKHLKLLIDSVNTLYFYELINEGKLAEIKERIELEINNYDLNNIKIKLI